MAQYRKLIEGKSRLFTDGTNSFRLIVTDGVLYIQRNKTALAFAGVEGTDWESVEPMEAPEGGTGEFRYGVNDTFWVWQEALTPTGFNGTINIDYTTITQEK